MIIKLLPVKNKTGAIGRVLEYIASDKGRITEYRNQGIFHNLLETNLPAIENEFEQNYKEYAVQRSNGNVAMHVVLSLSPIDRDKASIELMDDLVQTYIQRAFPNALAFAAHHKEQEHWHSHVLVSSNQVMRKEGTRLSKKDLKDIQQYMLDYMHEKYPRLQTDLDMDKWGQKLGKSNKAYHKEKRGKVLSKDILTQQIQDVFRQSQSTQEFHQNLKSAGFNTYTYKGETKGIYWNDGEKDKKMRFSRLGIKDMSQKALDIQHERLRELESLRDNTSDRETNREIEEESSSPEHDMDI